MKKRAEAAKEASRQTPQRVAVGDQVISDVHGKAQILLHGTPHNGWDNNDYSVGTSRPRA
jgi:hypothetical protein